MTTRPRALLALTAVLLATLPLARATAPASVAAAAVDDRPNVVLVLLDDMSMELLRTMRSARTMRDTGAWYPHSYVVDSLCCVSRASTFTGQYPHQTRRAAPTSSVRDDSGDPRGGWPAFVQHGNQERTVAVRLRQSGYTTGYVGKYLNEYDYRPGRKVPPPIPGWDTLDVVFFSAYDGWDFWSSELVDGRTEVRHHPAPPSSAPRREKDRAYAGRFIERTALDFVRERGARATRRTSCRWRPTRRTAGSTRRGTTPTTRSSPRPSATARTRGGRTATAARSPAGPSRCATCGGTATSRATTGPGVRTVDRARCGTGTRTSMAPRRPCGCCAAGCRCCSRPTGWSGASCARSGRTPTSSSPRTTASTSASTGCGPARARPTPATSGCPCSSSAPACAPGGAASWSATSTWRPTLERLAGLEPAPYRSGRSLLPSLARPWLHEQDYVFVEHTWGRKRPDDPDAKGGSALGVIPSYVAVRSRTQLLVRFDLDRSAAQRFVWEFYDLSEQGFEKRNDYGAPRHRRAVRVLTRKIEQLDACSTVVRGDPVPDGCRSLTRHTRAVAP